MTAVSKDLEYLNILKSIESIQFNIGKNLLMDFLQGNAKNESIIRNRLNKKELFGCFALYERKELEDLIENLFNNDIIEYKSLPDNKFVKVLALTQKGHSELAEPALYKKKLSNNFKIKPTDVTADDRALFNAFDFFLKNYNDDQKKAIVSNKNRILCVAGAGSGKTTALTKRIEFLTAFRTVNPQKILAITFTRKARTEMASRLSKSQYCYGVMIETFNSFCEKIVREHEDLIYKRKTRVISYSEKINLFKAALRENKIDANDAIEQYFAFGQRREKTNEELIQSLMNDCYFVIESYKINNMPLDELLEIAAGLDDYDKSNLEMIYRICNHISQLLKKLGLRDYSDQIIDCINFFKNNGDLIPKFEHILVDEYQDVNSLQIELLDLLNPENLFYVGDPRQSIFGWRGSKIKYILSFEEKYPDSEIITLSTNYRSSRKIVDLINKSLEGLRLPDLIPNMDNEAEIYLSNFDSEEEEMNYIAGKVLELNTPRNQIFVLARTNRLISEISQIMKLKGIKHIVKTEEMNKNEEAASDEITLATIHSIKGMEAGAVFIIGCSNVNFPCKASDHPVIELVKVYDYDKEEEERRLFYVALSRAKNSLYLSYSGKNHTRFLNEKMMQLIKKNKEKSNLKIEHGLQNSAIPSSSDVLSRLKVWRRELSQKLNLPAYIIMHDKTLLEIVGMNPVDVEDLKNVRGIGNAKIEKYGKDIIDVIHGKR